MGVVLAALLPGLVRANEVRMSGPVAEETFALLQIGTNSYTNVTITTKAKDYVFILHSGGMMNIKVADLPPDLRVRLGYSVAKTREQTNNPGVLAKQMARKVDAAQVKAWRDEVKNAWLTRATRSLSFKRLTGRAPIIAISIVLIPFYFFFCHCCRLICRKTGNEPSGLIWLPLLKLLPLLEAAGMSRWWIVAFFVPVLNVAAQILWSVRIAQARGKGIGIAILLMLPVTYFFAILYLAFSGEAPRQGKRPVEIMALETS
jgi:hypothetical protein